MNPAAERIGTLVLAATLQVCGLSSERGAAAQPVTDPPTGGRIVATIEVLEKVRAARQKDPGTFGNDVRLPSLLPQVSDYPTMTVNIDPADPADFVVTINDTRYPSGARAFRVVPGTASMIGSRSGDADSARSATAVTTRPPRNEGNTAWASRTLASTSS